MQSEKKQHFTITETLSCHLDPVLLGSNLHPPPPIHTESTVTFLQSFVTTHRGHFPCLILGLMGMKKPCCTPIARLSDHVDTGWVSRSGGADVDPPPQRCDKSFRRWDGGEIERLRHFKSPDDWGQGRWIHWCCSAVKLELHLGSAPLCVCVSKR